MRVFSPFFRQLLTLLIFSLSISAVSSQTHPNILLIIADDLGVDVSNGYHQGMLMPTTPTLDSLRATGITFEQVWSAPQCTPTRAAIMSGKYGIKTGILSPPGNLDTSHVSVLRNLASLTNNAYADAVIGKWHISQPVNLDHPAEHGADYFMGIMDSGVDDYYSWEKSQDGMTITENSYVTSTLTDTSLAWIDRQSQPWMLWLAHVAPHAPQHVPPSHMFSINNTNPNRRKYIAMIEAMDYEIGRLLGSLADSVRDNTIVIYVGDNGTPQNFTQDYPDGHGKSTLYQGGIRVPMIVSGAGVTRQGEREPALIHVADIHATILEIAGAELPGGLYNSLSFHHLLTNSSGTTRDYNYSEYDTGWTIRDAQYKLIEHDDGSQEFYDLLADSLEFTDLLLGGLTAAQQLRLEDLEIEAEQIRTAWSCRDHIQNGDEAGIDCGGSDCEACMISSIEEGLYQKEFLLYPNPVSDKLTIARESGSPQESSLIRLYDMMGRECGTYILPIGQEKIEVDCSQLETTILFVHITGMRTGSQRSSIYKLSVFSD